MERLIVSILIVCTQFGGCTQDSSSQTTSGSPHLWQVPEAEAQRSFEDPQRFYTTTYMVQVQAGSNLEKTLIGEGVMPGTDDYDRSIHENEANLTDDLMEKCPLPNKKKDGFCGATLDTVWAGRWVYVVKTVDMDTVFGGQEVATNDVH